MTDVGKLNGSFHLLYEIIKGEINWIEQKIDAHAEQ